MLSPIWDAFFGGKYAGKHFCERRFPNQAHPPKAFPLGGRCPSAHTGADEGATGLPNGAGEERRRGDRSLLLQGKVGYRIAPSSVTFGDSFPPRGSLRRCYTPATQFILARPLLPQNANPNQGTDMGTVIVPRPEQCGTIAKTSECQRAGHQKRGGGGPPPRLFASGLSLEKAWIPARDRAGTHVAGLDLRRSQKGPPAAPGRGPRPHLRPLLDAGPESPHQRQLNLAMA